MAELATVEGVGMTVKKKNTRGWILIDSKVNETIMDVDKYAIMHRVQIHARDLRILDPLLTYPSAILGRERAIVLNLEHIKAIVTAEEVLLRDPSDDNVIPVIEELRRRLPVINANQGELGGQSDVETGDEDGFLLLIICATKVLFSTKDLISTKFLIATKDVATKDIATKDVATKDFGFYSYSLVRSVLFDFWILDRMITEYPFEFRALEVFLEAICSFHAARTTEIEIDAYPALDKLTSKISGHNLDRVHKLKSAMTRLTARVQKVRDELVRLLDDDNDLADMYLSRKLSSSSPVSGSGAANWFLGSPTICSKISRASRASVMTVHEDENDVEELAMLLEAYFMQIDETLNKLTSLRNYIDDTKAYIKIKRDNHRNQLIKLENFITRGNLCMSIHSLVTAIFGMNIPYKWNQDHGYMFKWVVILSGAFSAVLFLLTFLCSCRKARWILNLIKKVPHGY
ncbi:hypothetical protein CTI12_AA215360 [Artemisia annua]|uniref:Magnesium transporter n=1 Tax=Artemisia annua TaxID=35608 RepID=A0A2U1M362_ARTAN|nr:hypothetical protein CTI12_AA215360 [Artemisia annua]